MNTQDIIAHKYGARDLYAQLQATTIQEAAQEPLTLEMLRQLTMSKPLPTGNIVDYGTAVCFVCLKDLVSHYARKNKPDDASLEFMAKQMMAHFPHWTVLDLPTFVNMCIMARIPTVKNGTTEYELICMDIPSILGKTEEYDRMKPRCRDSSAESQAPAEKPLTKWHLAHKMGGAEYHWPDYESAWRYWKHQPNFDDPQEMAFIKAAGGSQPILPSVNKVLGLQ